MTAALCFQGVCKDDLDKVLNDFYLLKQLIMTVVCKILTSNYNKKLQNHNEYEWKVSPMPNKLQSRTEPFLWNDRRRQWKI